MFTAPAEAKAKPEAAAARKKALLVPREHGAWGILLVPLVTGASVGLLAGGSASSLVPLVFAAITLFWLRTPLESWMGTSTVRARTPREMDLVRNAVFGSAAVSCSSLTWLFWGGRNRNLVWIGAGAAAAFLAQIVIKPIWRRARTYAQMIGAMGLTATAPAAYYAVTGKLGGAAWCLWAANFLFGVNQIHFVQLRIHTAQLKTRGAKLLAGHAFLAGQLTLAGLLVAAVALHLAPWYAVLAFVPILFRGFAWFARVPKPLAVHALGKSELAYACAFGVLLILLIGR
jgi:YwiC-like protein